ncbi:MAG: hypothetical protein VYA54_10540 [Bdellovibrionota bacterium]|nr:hypothetical protein [Bdellovibrionota bacterium]
MKSIVLIALLSLSSMAFAKSSCTVYSSDSELTQGMNKDTICREAFFAVVGSYTEMDQAQIVIQTSGRGMYHVNLGSIKILMNSGEAYSAKGTLHWYPGDEYVVLE